MALANCTMANYGRIHILEMSVYLHKYNQRRSRITKGTCLTRESVIDKKIFNNQKNTN